MAEKGANKGLLERLDEGIVLGDGGYLLELEKRGWVQAGPFTPEVSIVHPEALVELHREFLSAGADVLQTLTFYASEEKLKTVGLADRLDDINRAAVRAARQVADEGDALVAGNLSLTWAYDAGDPASHRRVRELFERQLAVQCDEGVDFLIGETFSWVGEALIALEAIRAAGLPGVITLSFELEPRSQEGWSAGECAKRLVDAGADVVGINCLRSPEHTLPLMREMREAVSAHLCCQPVGYRTTHQHPDFTSLPEFPQGLEPLQLSRAEMADYAVQARELGIRYIGSCCGSVACHVRAMAKALGKLPAEERAWRSTTGKPMSAYEYYDHDGMA
ncbi:MAG TPA: homocysteine S-methyltransferase family protein [Thermoanaerobaculia bacterium]|nr:homocysteine S-methyltransferase family protein [Thermoanaerobaculia bacterium]